MKTLDIILFSGKGWVSRAIKLGSFSRFSHVGIMIDEDTLLESTTLNGANGVRTIKISELLETYPGKMYRMKYNGYEPRDKKREIIDNFVKETVGLPYNKSTWEVMKSAIDWLPNVEEDLTSYFCSELVAELLQQLDLVTEKLPSDSWSPKEISRLYKTGKWEKAKRI